jgi:hypothetical protein
MGSTIAQVAAGATSWPSWFGASLRAWSMNGVVDVLENHCWQSSGAFTAAV